MVKSKDVKYAEALNELESIVDELQSETVDVDELSQKVKRAFELITVCKDKIKVTEADVSEILSKFDDGDKE